MAHIEFFGEEGPFNLEKNNNGVAVVRACEQNHYDEPMLLEKGDGVVFMRSGNCFQIPQEHIISTVEDLSAQDLISSFGFVDERSGELILSNNTADSTYNYHSGSKKRTEFIATDRIIYHIEWFQNKQMMEELKRLRQFAMNSYVVSAKEFEELSHQDYKVTLPDSSQN